MSHKDNIIRNIHQGPGKALTLDDRDNFNICLVGANRTGKSATAVELAEAWVSAKPEHYKVIAHDPQKRFGHLTDYEFHASEADWDENLCNIGEKRNNLLVIIDEFNLPHDTMKKRKHYHTLLCMREEWNIDIMYILHYPGLIPPYVTGYTTHYCIFRTESTIDSFQKKIPNYLHCIAASSYVNEYVKHFGKGLHPLDPKFTGQTFPYIVFNNESQEMDAYNFIPERVDYVTAARSNDRSRMNELYENAFNLKMV